MRTSFAARTAATSIATIATALSLGLTALPAGAAEPTASFSTFAIDSNVMTSRETTQFFGTVETTAPVASATTVVTVNGRVKGSVPLILGTGNGGVDLPRRWGAGQVQLGPTTFTYADGTTSTVTTREFFNARRNVKTTRKDNLALAVRRTGDRVRFRVQQLKVLRPVAGTYASLGRVRLQSLRGGTWRDIARVRLDAKGNGTATMTIAKKYRYRLLSDQSATRVGFSTARTGRI